MDLEKAKGPSDLETFTNGFLKENPVFVQVLGTCPVLAVTTSMVNALAMGVATTFVLVFSNLFIASIRHIVPKQVRIAVYILVIATFVTMVQYFIDAISVEISKALGAFIALIVVNCIILGRAEAFASKNTIRKSVLDGIGMGIGFTFALVCLGSVREILGSGRLLGFDLFGPKFEPWVTFALPSGGFFVFGGWLLLFSWIKSRQQAKAQA